jgi:hypothetical protein
VTAEPIARVIHDLHHGRIRHTLPDRRVTTAAIERAQRDQPIVDATPIYRSLVAKDTPVDLYGDHPCIAPPWDDAAICYVNEHGNAIVAQTSARPWPANLRWDTPNDVAWDELRWLLDAFVWVGGRSAEHGEMPTTGPCHLMQYAVMPDGNPADIHYVHLMPDYPLEMWDMAQCTLLAALNFLACKNVEIAEPQRPRPERRRLARLDVRVHTLVVRPAGRRSGGGGTTGDGAVPLHSVRGHFAEYGEQYGKGLLFGRYSGRFWIPGHARGSTDHGEIRKDYLLTPGGAA